MTDVLTTLRQYKDQLKNGSVPSQMASIPLFYAMHENLLMGKPSVDSIVSFAADYTAKATDSVILIDTTDDNRTVTLPQCVDVVSVTAGTTKLFFIKKSDSGGNSLTIQAHPDDTIEGSPSVALTSPFESIILLPDGNDWYVMSSGSGGGGGTGDVVGPASATDHAIARWNGSSGELLQDSAVTVDDTGNITAPGFLDITEVSEPATPSADHLRLFAEDERGFSVIRYKDATGAIVQLCRDTYFIARNTSGGLLSKGTVVTVTGSTGTVPNVSAADASDPDLAAFGFLIADTANNAFCRVLALGSLEDVDTSVEAEGTLLYLSTTPGEWTSTPPTHPNIKQLLGRVTNQNVANGSISVAVGPVQGIEQGTLRNTFNVGDDTVGTKIIRFRNGFDLDLSAAPSADRVLTLPDATGTLALAGAAPALHASSHLPGGADEIAEVLSARGLRETSGPTALAMGAVADGEYLVRSGATIIGAPISGGGMPSVPYVQGATASGYTFTAADVPGANDFTMLFLMSVDIVNTGGDQEIVNYYQAGVGGYRVWYNGNFNVSVVTAGGTRTVTFTPAASFMYPKKWMLISVGHTGSVGSSLTEIGANGRVWTGSFSATDGTYSAPVTPTPTLLAGQSGASIASGIRLEGVAYCNSFLNNNDMADLFEAAFEAGQITQVGSLITRAWSAKANTPAATWTGHIGAPTALSLIGGALPSGTSSYPLWL